MNDDHRMLTGGIVVAAALVTLILAALLGFSVWLVLPPVVAVGAVAALTRRGYGNVDLWASGRGKPTEPPPQPEPDSSSVTEVMLPSNTPDYQFKFAATVLWTPVPGARPTQHGDLGAVARNAVIARATSVTQGTAPADHALVRYRLAAALGVGVPAEDGQIRAWATDIELGVPDADANRIRTMAGLRKDVEIWEHERDHERNVREYLGADALRTTGSALVWWLARHTDQVDEAVSLIEHLDRLSAVAQGRSDPGRLVTHDQVEAAEFWEADVETTLRLVDLLHPDTESPLRVMFVRDLARIADGTGSSDYGERIRDRFGIPNLDEVVQDDTDLIAGEDGDDQGGDGGEYPPAA
jgi:hypothetical protein